MKVYYDIFSKRFISFGELMSDFVNHYYRSEKRQYSVLVLDDSSPFYSEKINEIKNVEQISFFDTI